MGVDRFEPPTGYPPSWVGRRVVITGSDGFIGHHIAARLEREGALVHEIHGRLDCDLRDPGATRARVAAARPQIVVHLAANPDRPDPFGADETVAMTRNLLDALAPGPPCVVIHTGSYKQYGLAPMPFDETTTPDPVTAYGLAKHRSEELILAAAAAGHVRAVALRIGPVYGPQQHPDTLISTLVRHTLGAADDRLTLTDKPWDPVYVTDVCDAILRAGDRVEAWGHVVNISGGMPYLPVEVLALVADITGGEAPAHRCRSELTPSTLASYGQIARAEALLGWRPKTSLSQGVRLILEEDRDDLIGVPVVGAPSPAS